MASFSSFTVPRLPGMIGTPAASIVSRARALSPIRRMTLGLGPMNRRWQASHTSAKCADSARKPYPGWMASYR